MSGRALVLGAGIMGLSAAWALARAGWAVRVVEQGPVPNPRAASFDQHRLIRHAYGSARGYQRMVDAAFAAWDLLWAEAGERHYVETGVLALAAEPGGWLAESRAALADDGHALLPPALLAFLDPGGIAEGFRLARGGVLLADRILATLARLCAARGVTFEQGEAVAVDPARAAVRLADGRTLGADLLLVAAGPWAGRLLPGRGIRPSRQVVVYLDPPPAFRAAWAAAPMLLDLREDAGFYAVPPVAGTPLKLGDHRFSLMGDPEDPREATPSEAAAILELARPRLRDLGAYRLLGARACYYEVAGGSERIVLAPLGPAAWVLTGTAGHGFKFGTVLGLAFARAVADARLAAALPGWAAGEAPPPPGLLQPTGRDQ